MDLAAARETFEASQDLTVGIEEEYALVHPETLELIPKFEELRDAGATDSVLATAISGELISSEIEIRSGRGEDVADARARQQEARRRLFALAESHGARLASTGTPSSPMIGMTFSSVKRATVSCTIRSSSDSSERTS